MFTKLLVANRAEIAARIIRTARTLDIPTVAVYSDPDADLPYVHNADEAVHLPGSTPTDTYLNAAALVTAAQATGADAIHPGYGFLSENATFARAVAAAGITFVGPTPDAIDAMGSKIAAKELMAAAGVPVLPSLPVTGDELPGASRIGYPLLVKAAFGGGGRGMRIVTRPDDLAEAVEGARREAASAFGDGTVFLERLVEAPRHVEVQIVGDTRGEVAHLFERECSIQRRYQKIIEEAPSPAVDDRLRGELTAAAIAAGKAIGYVGAGTVEFVLDASGAFYFLEVNTRLQVEHPVTEMITGLDLVEIQLRIAAGEPLPREVREARVTGHAIEARLYAEDVRAGYAPVSGPIHALDVPTAPGIRVDAGFAAGNRVSTYYDSMLAKVVGYGPTRESARRRLSGALHRARIHGVVTNRDLLVGVLREPEFAAGRTDTGYLSRHSPADLCGDPAAPPPHALAAALAGQADRRATAPVLRSLPSGWRNNPSAPQRASFDGYDVTYRVTGDRVTATVNGEPIEAVLHAVTASSADLTVAGSRRTVAVHRVGEVSYVDSALGHSTLVELPRFAAPGRKLAAGSLVAPVPGTVVRVVVAAGDTVTTGQPLVAIEAMKMEHVITAPAGGVLTELRVATGDRVDGGTVVAVLDGSPA